MLANTVAALTVCVVVFWAMDHVGALPRPADDDNNPLAMTNSDMRRIVSALVREVDQLAAEKLAAHGQRVFGPGIRKRDCSTLTCFTQRLAHELAMDNQRTDTADPYSPGRKRRSAEEESDH
uniref:Adrenomedullin n=1 Tax=Branchiostoma japonicum TaxID=373177 RepID=A0A0S1NEM1_9BRAN|nr:adrenomedullin [Branchiostoma japonicum]